MEKTDLVFGVVFQERTQDKRTLLLFEVGDTGLWSLPGGPVGDHATEEDALRHWLHEQYGGRVTVCEQLGPVHALPNGKTAKAFVCINEGDHGNALDPFAQCMFFEQDDLLTAVEVDPYATRMVWDGFSLRGEPAYLPLTSSSGVTGIYCHPGKEHLLVEERDGWRLVWCRLDPKNGLPMGAP